MINLNAEYWIQIMILILVWTENISNNKRASEVIRSVKAQNGN